MHPKTIRISGILITFITTLILALSNANFQVLGFADAAEFALLTDIAGIAHAPGFPAYILAGKLFSVLLSIVGIQHLAALVILSAVCLASAAALLYRITEILLHHSFTGLHPLRNAFIATSTALAPVTGTTIWHWSHSAEVYSAQILFVTMVMYGLTLRETGKSTQGIWWTAIGIGLGLSNHHLTMILLLPFAALLWRGGWLIQSTTAGKKNKNIKPQWSWNDFRRTAMIATIVMVFFYGWMYFRASVELPYAFGNPDTLDRLFYHLKGGAWMQNTKSVVKGIIGMRTPYFLRITFEQFFFCGIFLALGIIYLYTSKRHRLWMAITGYFLVLFLYQLRIDQTADTDAYLCTPYFLLYTLLPFGMARVCTWYARAFYFLPVFIIAQAFIHFPKTDLRDFDLSTALLRDLDLSASKGSVVIIADWTNVINYHYARIHDNFREDLIVLNYDLKFTHYDLIRRNYPEFYKAISASYDRYIQLLGQYHPEEIYNTGCTLDQPDLLQAYLETIRSIQAYCEQQNVPFIADPKAFVFLSQQQLFPVTHISGSYVSNRPGTGNDQFLQLNHQWLKNRHVRMDPSAADKIVDLEAAMDFQRMYWKQTGDSSRLRIAEKNYKSIKQMQNKMKKKMNFLFRPAS